MAGGRVQPDPCARILAGFLRECIELLEDGKLDVRVTRGATERRYRFHATWTRVEISDCGSARLHLSSGAVKLHVGDHVTAPQRRRFEREMREALRARLEAPAASAPSRLAG